VRSACLMIDKRKVSALLKGLEADGATRLLGKLCSIGLMRPL